MTSHSSNEERSGEGGRFVVDFPVWCLVTLSQSFSARNRIERARSCPFTLSPLPTREACWGRGKQIVGLVTRAPTSGSCRLGHPVTSHPAGARIGKTRPPAASQMSDLHFRALCLGNRWGKVLDSDHRVSFVCPDPATCGKAVTRSFVDP
jgi:hypothetical protein